MWNLVQKYLKSNKEFEIRFAIVMILDYYIDEELANIINFINNRDDLENNKFVLNKENISNVSNINDITSMINSKSNINNNSLNQHINNKPNITLDSLPVIELDTKDNKNSNLNLDDEDDNDNYFDDFYE